MRSLGIFTNELPMAITSEPNIADNISILIEMLDYSKQYDTKYYSDIDSLYDQEIFDSDFADWLYDQTDGETRDIKREIQILINQSETISSDVELETLISQIDTFIVGKPFPQFIWSIWDFLTFKQNRLKEIDVRVEFSKELDECFNNIYFDESVHISIRNLNNNFKEIKDDIVFHLQKLDDFFENFKKMFQKGYGFEELSCSFKEYSGIDCSPQAGRDGTKKLIRKYKNSITGNEEEITCELHTKFSNHNRDKAKQDRIYFHPGKLGICGGKIIVILIGKHA